MKEIRLELALIEEVLDVVWCASAAGQQQQRDHVRGEGAISSCSSGGNECRQVRAALVCCPRSQAPSLA